MKIRLKQPGWETFSGQLGVLNFVDGVTDTDVSRFDALRLSATLACEDENGVLVSVTQDLIERNDIEAPVVQELERGTDEDASTEGVDLIDEDDEVPNESEVKTSETYTQADLEKLADEGGIKAIRAIATPLGVRAQSIPDLIKGLIKGGFATPTQAE